jgi:hypothetical protein
MTVAPQFQADVDAILARRNHLGADLWTTPDKRLIKGTPFSTLDCALLLLELGVDPSDPNLQSVADLIWSVWREDGRFKLAQSGAIYPCHTSIAANVLCHLGYATDPRLQKTFQHLLDIQYHDGGWRCNKFSFGRGPETEFSNPGTTLIALSAFRFTSHLNQDPRLDQAVEFLLNHWTIRIPIGPCHYGIGTLFQQVEYPLATTTCLSTSTSCLSTTGRRKIRAFLRHWHCLSPRCLTARSSSNASTASWPVWILPQRPAQRTCDAPLSGNQTQPGILNQFKATSAHFSLKVPPSTTRNPPRFAPIRLRPHSPREGWLPD